MISRLIEERQANSLGTVITPAKYTPPLALVYIDGYAYLLNRHLKEARISELLQTDSLNPLCSAVHTAEALATGCEWLTPPGLSTNGAHAHASTSSRPPPIGIAVFGYYRDESSEARTLNSLNWVCWQLDNLPNHFREFRRSAIYRPSPILLLHKRGLIELGRHKRKRRQHLMSSREFVELISPYCLGVVLPK